MLTRALYLISCNVVAKIIVDDETPINKGPSILKLLCIKLNSIASRFTHY
jgi:hypothetical protein